METPCTYTCTCVYRPRIFFLRIIKLCNCTNFTISCHLWIIHSKIQTQLIVLTWSDPPKKKGLFNCMLLQNRKKWLIYHLDYLQKTTACCTNKTSDCGINIRSSLFSAIKAVFISWYIRHFSKQFQYFIVLFLSLCESHFHSIFYVYFKLRSR